MVTGKLVRSCPIHRPRRRLLRRGIRRSDIMGLANRTGVPVRGARIIMRWLYGWGFTACQENCPSAIRAADHDTPRQRFRH